MVCRKFDNISPSNPNSPYTNFFLISRTQQTTNTKQFKIYNKPNKIGNLIPFLINISNLSFSFSLSLVVSLHPFCNQDFRMKKKKKQWWRNPSTQFLSFSSSLLFSFLFPSADHSFLRLKPLAFLLYIFLERDMCLSLICSLLFYCLILQDSTNYLLPLTFTNTLLK